MKKISIILPVYNTELYIEKCVESILQQSFSDFELIILNDGSTDNSEHILFQLAEKDNRIVFHSFPNSGVYKIRNRGLEMATGEYICFVDSDDWVDENFLQDFISHLSDNKTRLVVQDLKRIALDGSTERNIQQYNNELLEIPRDLEKFISNYRYTQGYLVNKIFKQNILQKNAIVFDEEMVANADETFYLKYIQYVDEILFQKNDHYNYVECQGSISKKFPTFISVLHHLKSTINFGEFLLKNKNSETVKQYNAKKFNHIFDHLLRNCIYRNKYTKKERIGFLKTLYNEIKNRLPILQGSTKLKKIDYFLFKNRMFLLLDFILKRKAQLN
jgi:glycosyltransferase involved in cell wall biosynthesis